MVADIEVCVYVQSLCYCAVWESLHGAQTYIQSLHVCVLLSRGNSRPLPLLTNKQSRGDVYLHHVKSQRKKSHALSACGGSMWSTGSRKDTMLLCPDSIDMCFTQGEPERLLK